MRPLSLATFAELEGAGVPLSSLSGKDAAMSWARLFAHLAGRTEPDAPSKLLAELLQDPIAFKRFQHAIQDSLQQREEAAEGAKKNKRTVKNPLEDKKSPKQDMREDESESEEPLDVTYLLLLSRLSGISLSDLSRMTFRGIGSVQEFLKEHPPDPPIASLLGKMG